MEGIREFLNKPAGRVVAVVIALAGLGVATWILYDSLVNVPEELSNKAWFVDTETGKGFRAEMDVGQTVPIRAPSGKDSGYPAELCFWTADGGSKPDPTPVVLNHWLGKEGPTFCPDCGRLVVGHNPAPREGLKPPPKREEYRPGREGERN